MHSKPPCTVPGHHVIYRIPDEGRDNEEDGQERPWKSKPHGNPYGSRGSLISPSSFQKQHSISTRGCILDRLISGCLILRRVIKAGLIMVGLIMNGLIHEGPKTITTLPVIAPDPPHGAAAKLTISVIDYHPGFLHVYTTPVRAYCLFDRIFTDFSLFVHFMGRVLVNLNFARKASTTEINN